MEGKTKSQNILIGIIVVTILGVLVSVLCLAFIDDTQKVLSWISYIGSVLTLIGLAITFYQTTVVEQKAKDTEVSVKEQIKNTLSTIDITKAKLIVDFVIENMTAEKFEMAYYRMVELNDIMANIVSDEALKTKVDSNIDDSCRKLISDMDAVHKYINATSSKYDVEVIIADLHRIRTFLNEASNYINTLSYGRS